MDEIKVWVDKIPYYEYVVVVPGYISPVRKFRVEKYVDGTTEHGLAKEYDDPNVEIMEVEKLFGYIERAVTSGRIKKKDALKAVKNVVMENW